MRTEETRDTTDITTQYVNTNVPIRELCMNTPAQEDRPITPAEEGPPIVIVGLPDTSAAVEDTTITTDTGNPHLHGNANHCEIDEEDRNRKNQQNTRKNGYKH